MSHYFKSIIHQFNEYYKESNPELIQNEYELV